jgi:DNA (cytosine-5)-methyltransferase 1
VPGEGWQAHRKMAAMHGSVSTRAPTDAKTDVSFSLVDLFAGCGGITRGFLDADPAFRPTLAVEKEVAEAATYAANFPTATVVANEIEALDIGSIAEADVVVGGPPCQGFSGLGKRDPEDHRNSLWRAYMDIVLAANPKVFVIENVGRFFASPEFAELTNELRVGRLRHYQFDHRVLNAADFGVPQRRQRAILVASRVGKPIMPVPTHDRYGRMGRQTWRTVLEAIGTVERLPKGSALPARFTLRDERLLPGPFKTEELHVGRTYRPESLERYAVIAPGQGRLDLPDEMKYRCWIDKPKGTSDVLGRLRWEAPSVTIRTEFFKPEKGRYLHPEWSDEPGGVQVNRALTHLEAALLQGFPLDYQWMGTKVQIARQIGNAVPPGLAREIARQSVLPLLRLETALVTSPLQLELLEDELGRSWIPGSVLEPVG